MKRNKMRTFLTGFAVAWGIFLLIILLGAGQGLRNGVQSNFESQALNLVHLYPGWSSMPYKGWRADRRITFDERTVELVRNQIPDVDRLTGVIFHNTTSVSYGDQYGTWQILGAGPDVSHIHYMDILKGRLPNEADERQKRKVLLLPTIAERVLFPNGEESLGNYVTVDGVPFQVVGVYKWPTGEDNGMPIFAPFSVAKALYDRGRGLNRIDFTVNGITTKAEAEAFNERVRAVMGPYCGFDPADTSAMYIYNNSQESLQIQTIMRFVTLFLWVIGFASLMAGLVGVANIMLVTVKERTREIGIRKALGATPWSIVKMVIIEAIFVTTAAGYIGIILGLGLTELIGKGLSTGSNAGNGMNVTMFKDPTVGLGIVFAVLGLLVVCGIVAGLIPSLRATKIRPIEAMRAD